MARFEPRPPNSEFKVLIARQPRPRNNVTFVIHLSQSFGLIPFTHVERVAYNIFSHEYVIRCGVVKMVAVHWCGQLYIHMHCRQCPTSCLGHTIGRMVVIYTTLGKYRISIVVKKFLLHYNLHAGPNYGKVD